MSATVPRGGSLPRPAGLPPVTLGQLARVAGADVSGPPAPPVTGVTGGSALVRPGDLFVARPGASGHGARFVPDARAAGAVAVLTDPAGAALLPADVPALVAADVAAVTGPVAAAVYGEPSRALTVLGVTGTSGKTTTCYLLRAGLEAAGLATGLIGTVATLVGDQEVRTGFTTPEAPELQALLAVMRERGVQAVAMEVSSHALALGRAGGTHFAVGAFTNLSLDHLDLHGDMESYFEAKALLFDGRAARGVVCVDDEWGARLAARTPVTTVSTGGAPADWTVRDVRVQADGSTRFVVVGPGGELPAGCAVPGAYNVANTVVALAVLAAAGVAPDTVADAVAAAVVPGRMERVEGGQPWLAVVDYSHKPAAVAGALEALRPLTAGRLTIVLGCGGDRDRATRPAMGEVAARDADRLVVTDDNPRSEDPAAIRAAMLAGALAVPAACRGEVVEIGERAAAIADAVAHARPGDTVLVAGKGHETGQEIAGVVHPFDDRDVLRRAIAAVAS